MAQSHRCLIHVNKEASEMKLFSAHQTQTAFILSTDADYNLVLSCSPEPEDVRIHTTRPPARLNLPAFIYLYSFQGIWMAPCSVVPLDA